MDLIKGVVIKNLKKHADERGFLMEILRNDDEIFEKFGQVYVSKNFPDITRAWHYHKKQVDHFCCIDGMVKVALYDAREDSETKGMVNEFFIGENNYCLVKIPFGIWNGFKGIGNKPALVANCATLGHSPDEIIRKDPFTRDIPYNWELIHR